MSVLNLHINQAIGAYGGGKVGAIRDAKGKAVATVFKEMGGDQKAAILQALLSKGTLFLWSV